MSTPHLSRLPFEQHQIRSLTKLNLVRNCGQRRSFDLDSPSYRYFESNIYIGDTSVVIPQTTQTSRPREGCSKVLSSATRCVSVPKRGSQNLYVFRFRISLPAANGEHSNGAFHFVIFGAPTGNIYFFVEIQLSALVCLLHCVIFSARHQATLRSRFSSLDYWLFLS